MTKKFDFEIEESRRLYDIRMQAINANRQVSGVILGFAILLVQLVPREKIQFLSSESATLFAIGASIIYFGLVLRLPRTNAIWPEEVSNKEKKWMEFATNDYRKILNETDFVVRKQSKYFEGGLATLVFGIIFFFNSIFKFIEWQYLFVGFVGLQIVLIIKICQERERGKRFKEKHPEKLPH